MTTYVILDTSIYRQLGLNIKKNIDYKNLCGFLIATDNELLLIQIVIKELVNYYEKQLDTKLNSYSSSTDCLIRDNFFNSKTLKKRSYKREKNKAIKLFKESISSDPKFGHPFAEIETANIPTLELVDFILSSNKNNSNNIPVRDYLIWVSLLEFAQEESKDRKESLGSDIVTFKATNIAFITNDRGFSTNIEFIQKKKALGIKNLTIYESIPEFLNKFGFNNPFLTKDLIYNFISKQNIKKDLLTDPGCFLSYISRRYTPEECNKRPILSFTVKDFEILEFYSYKENKHDKFVAHLKVLIEIVYEQDKDLIKFKNHILNLQKDSTYYLETYDKEGHPIFESPILYMINGVLDVKNKKIVSYSMTDFMLRVLN